MRYGARVEKHGADISEAKTYAMELAKKENLLYVNGYVTAHADDNIMLNPPPSTDMTTRPFSQDRAQLLWRWWNRWTERVWHWMQ